MPGRPGDASNWIDPGRTRPSHARQAIAVCRQCAAVLRATAAASPDPTTWRVLRALARMVEERAARLSEGKGLSRR